MIDVERLPLLALVVFMVAGACAAAGYLLGQGSVPNTDEAASARQTSFRVASVEAIRERQPEAYARGRRRGRDAGRATARSEIDAVLEQRREASRTLAARRTLSRALARQRASQKLGSLRSERPRITVATGGTKVPPDKGARP
jgi:hypothetical protein